MQNNSLQYLYRVAVILIVVLGVLPKIVSASSCVSGAQTAAGYPLVTAVCSVQWSSFTASPPTGNDGNKYDIYYITADGLNANNKRPIEIWSYGGGFATAASAQPASWASYYSQRALDGKIVIVQAYTTNTVFKLAAALNPSDTTATIVWPGFTLTPCSDAYYPAGQSNVVFNVGTDVVTVTSALSACDSSNHVVNVTRTNPSSTQASGTFMYLQKTGWPVQGNDMAGLLAFLAHCAPGGSSYNTGTCTGFTNVAGDPRQISLWGVSAGGQLNTMLIELGNCKIGSTCTLLNNTPGTPGYHEWTDTGWAIYNPSGAVPMVGASIASLTGRTYGLNALFQTYDTMMTGNGVPSCTAGFDSTALTCTTPSTSYTTSLAQDSLTAIQSGTPFNSLQLVQAGVNDTSFYKWETLLGSQPGFLYHSYAGLGHVLDYLTGTPTTSTAFKEARAVLGVNNCTQLSANMASCPTPNPIVGSGGVF